MPDESSRPNWYGHISALVAVLFAVSPLVKDWVSPHLISREDADRRVQEEVEAMARLAFEEPLQQVVIFEKDKDRYALKVFPDESIIQQRRYADGHEAYRYVPSLKTERHNPQAGAWSPILTLEAAESPENACERYGHSGRPTMTQKPIERCRILVELTWADGCTAYYVHDSCYGTSGSIKFSRCQH